jgi:hypothetical protein
MPLKERRPTSNSVSGGPLTTKCHSKMSSCKQKRVVWQQPPAASQQGSLCCSSASCAAAPGPLHLLLLAMEPTGMTRHGFVQLPRRCSKHKWLPGSYKGAIDLLSWDLLLPWCMPATSSAAHLESVCNEVCACLSLHLLDLLQHKCQEA